ncbi:MAG TPA: hypothetical protein VK797_27155 [Tepidisphaeraceae bacterium]|jgi:hypothetical protein|nr:hypothetical protein [Tepidisphaeraceae bacterium]
MSEPKQSFGEQAARFSFYTPLLMLVLGILSMTKQDRAVAIAIGSINALLAISGLILGVVALVSMRRYGRKRILGRAVVGTGMNAAIIGLVVSILMPAMHRAKFVHQLSGHWRLLSESGGPRQQIDFILNPDFTFRMERSQSEATRLAVSGDWGLLQNESIDIKINHIEGGDAAMVGKQMPLGAVKSVDEGRLVLATDHGDEVYQRVP